jgi:flagellar hook protein FlgE
MLRSLYAGISGLRSHQTMLDVTGNNIANVNTTAFKASTTQFQDTLSQLTQGASGPQAGVGGTNPAQVGLGVLVAGISTNFAQGSTQATGKAANLMISGDGFFVTRNGNQNSYTRAGDFDFDADGRLVTPDGSLVQGWGAVDGVVTDGGLIGDIQLPLDAIAAGEATTATSVGGNLPSDAVVGKTYVRDVEVFDATGASRSMAITFTKTAAGWDAAASDPNNPAGAATGTKSLTFANGVQTSAAGPFVVGGISVNLDKVSGFAELVTVAVTDKNGMDAGTLESYTMSKDGTVIGSFSNGASKALARVVLATFANPGGLEKAGGSSYRATFNSGEATIGAPGSAGYGDLTSGALEMSNVDLSQEFTNLIVAQRGFQANARIITTSDEVLQELTNLKR